MDAKKGDTLVVAGTKKGLFVLHSRDRRRWHTQLVGFEGNPVYHAMLDPADGTTLWAGVTSDHWGPSVQRSTSMGKTWKPSGAIHYSKASGLSVDRIWHVARDAHGGLWAGVEPAGLFHSADNGASWRSVDGFNAQPGRDKWMPGGGGLCLHTILPHPRDAKRMTIAASAVGIFSTEDGGDSWRLMNGGIRMEGHPRGKTEEGELGTCPHKLVRDAKDPDTLYMQNHWGVFRRKGNTSKWTAIQTGLPSRFGFPMVAHPRDGGTVYTVPLAGDFNRVTPQGALAVHRTRDGGKSWDRLSKGLPQANAFFTILREGLATDGKDPAGLYVGTTTGQLYASRDEGESWACIAEHLPPVLSVAAGVVG
jgi:hypothetical protein